MEVIYTPEWEMGAPVGIHCCSSDCPHGFANPEPASWTLLNPRDGGDPLYYCSDCRWDLP